MKFLSYGVMTYTLLALIWWSVLLTRTNKSLYEVRKELAILKNASSGETQTLELASLEEDYRRNRWMIMGEGSVFGILLIIGVWFIQNAYQKDMRATTKQKNFLLSVTHELKSPIAAMSLIMETMLRKEWPREKQMELCHNALIENHRLEKLIHNLLLSAKLDEGYTYNFEEHNIEEIMHDICQRYLIQQPDLRLSVEAKSDLSPIPLDKEAFQSIMSNLIENSIKYSPEPPVITISIEQNDHHTVISCADNGTGISDNEKQRITEQFYRIGNEETRQSKGTGLGLHIVHQIVKAHKGQLHFEDNTPEGLKVVIMLPRKINE
jgi:signal transduction histidine kinase